MRGGIALGLAMFLASVPLPAHAEPNLVTQVVARADGARTIVTVHGTATPSFTAYRLERPSRVVVDLADGRIATADGPIDVDTWAVGQIATAQYADEATRTARVMIGFKRAASYDVRAKGHDVIITITPDEKPPADVLVGERAKAAQARAERAQAEAAAQKSETRRQAAEAATQASESRRQQIEAATQKSELERRQAEAELAKVRQSLDAARAEEQKRGAAQDRAERAQADADARAQAAERKAAAAKARAEAAQASLARILTAQKSAQLSAEAARANAQVTQANAQAMQANAQAMQANARAVRASAQAMQKSAQAASQSAEAQAQKSAQAARANQAAAQKSAAVAEANQAAAQKSAAVAEANQAAAQRSAQAVQAAKAEAAKVAQETARLRSERAAEQARLESLKAEADALVKTRNAEAKKLAETQAQARMAQAARATQLKAAQAAAEKRAQASRAAQAAEEQRLQAQADQATRLAQAAEAARKLETAQSAIEAAETRAKEAADRASQELARLSGLRAQSQALEAAAETARVEVARQKAESARLLTLQAAERARVDHERTLAGQVASSRAQAAAEAARSASLASLSTAKLQAAEREARRIAELRAKESARLLAVQKQAQALEAERAAELQKIEAARAEARQVAEQKAQELQALADRKQAELKALAEKRAAEIKQLDSQRDAEDRAIAERRAEHATLDQKVAEARGELARLERAAKSRLAIVPTPAKLAAPERAPSDVRAALPVERVAARVENVRFDDASDAERVVIDLGGSPKVTVLRSDPTTAVLRIDGAELPKKLARTLDVSAYRGPISRVSTYVDPADPGAVRVVATFDGAASSEPKLARSGSQLAWEFARPAQADTLRSYPPERVGAFGASIPLQVAAAPQSLPTPQARGRRRVYRGRRISLDFKDIDIHNVLRLLADVGQVNIITSDDVKGSVTIRMVDVPWDQALDVILKAKQLGMVREGNLIRVAPEAQLAKEAEEEVARAKAAVELKPIDTRLIPLSYADADKLLPRVQDVLSPRGRASVDQRTNMLIVSDVAANIALAEDLVRNLDAQTPQVSIEARIVEANTTFLRDIGIQWGGNSINSAATGNPTGLVFPSTVGLAGGATDALTNTNGLQSQAATPNYVVNLPAPVGTGSGGALGLTLGSVNGNVNINLRLSSLENTGEVRIISAPKITTLDNIQASIEQGVSIPISVVSAAGTNTVFVDAKLNLTVKPHVTNEGSVIMNVAVTRNEPDFVNTAANGTPTIQKKQAHTEMLVRDGDTAVIGGIYTRNSGLSYAKVPWFGDIPVIGWLFKNRRENDDRTELLIFITPRIVNRAMVRR